MYRGWPFYFFPSFTVRRCYTTTSLWHGRSNAYLWFAPSNEGSALLKVVTQNHLINSWTEYNLWKVFLTDGFHSLCKAQCFQLSFTVHTLLGTKSLRFCPISPHWLFWNIWYDSRSYICISHTCKWFIGFDKNAFYKCKHLCSITIFCFYTMKGKFKI